MKSVQQGHRLTNDQLKEITRYSIFFEPKEFGGEVKEYIGWVERRNDISQICVIAEQFTAEGILKPEVESVLAQREYKNPYCLYMVSSDDDMKLVHGVMPAKL
ncbi:MAG: hypothetical protein ISS94_03590 [Candidatus Syntrophoarchaeum sp.]|nr:hypothetical protein [Candidatus Syntrophoarchaeum sp.]